MPVIYDHFPKPRKMNFRNFCARCDGEQWESPAFSKSIVLWWQEDSVTPHFSCQLAAGTQFIMVGCWITSQWNSAWRVILVLEDCEINGAWTGPLAGCRPLAPSLKCQSKRVMKQRERIPALWTSIVFKLWDFYKPKSKQLFSEGLPPPSSRCRDSMPTRGCVTRTFRLATLQIRCLYRRSDWSGLASKDSVGQRPVPIY